MGDMNNLGTDSSLALLLLKGKELLTVDLTSSALWYECSCNTWWLLLELDMFTSEFLITVLATVDISVTLLWTLGEGDGRHWDWVSLCFWFTNVVAKVGSIGKDIVTVLGCCIWDPSPVANCIIGWDKPSIFCNCSGLGILITTGCGMALVDGNKLADEVTIGLACNTLPTVSVVYLVVAVDVAVFLVTGSVGVGYLAMTRCGVAVFAAIFLVPGGRCTVVLVTGGGCVVFLVTGGGCAVFLVTGGGCAVFLATGGGGTVFIVMEGEGAVFMVTGGTVVLVTRWVGAVNLVTAGEGIVNITCDAAETIEATVEFVRCVIMVVTTAGGLGFVVNTSFFTASFGCFTTFLVVTVVDAKTQHTSKHKTSTMN